MKYIFFIVSVFILAFPKQTDAQSTGSNLSKPLWIDSVFNSFSTDEKIGQLLMVAAYSNRDAAHKEELRELVQDCKVGGLIFFQGGPVRQTNLLNYLQSISKLPLWIGIDGEWGPSMRLDSTIKYPRQMALGAIKNDSIVYNFGKEVARQCKLLGIHINFAPDVDVNTNPKNPVINDRSFGEITENVSNKGLAYMKGMQDNGVFANAKHFPGHGNTDKDSHYSLPTVNRSRAEMDSVELIPFKKLIAANVFSVMAAHLNVPALDTNAKSTSSISPMIVNGLLRTELGFQGIVFTDALNMKGISNFYTSAEIGVKALQAGNDILLFPSLVEETIAGIRTALDSGVLAQEYLDEKVKKVLAAKYDAGLNNFKALLTENLVKELNNFQAKQILEEVTNASITLVKNEIIPLLYYDTIRLAAISVGNNLENTFLTTLNNYGKIDKFSITKEASEPEYDVMFRTLQMYNRIILSFQGLNRSDAKNYGMSLQSIEFVKRLIQSKKDLVVVVFGNAYSLRNLEGLDNLIVAYEENQQSMVSAASAVFGGEAMSASLPVSASVSYPAKSGFDQLKEIRLGYSQPESQGLNVEILNEIDSIALKAIGKKAMPGCQILIARNNKIVYQKSFGNFTYDSSHLVVNADLYDIASITKIASTTLAAMKLYESKKLVLNKKLGYYLSAAKSTNKKNILISDLLTHQAGLIPFIPYWKKSLNGNNYDSSYSDQYSIRVAEKLYLKKDYLKTIKEEVYSSALTDKGKYVYSDLSMYLLKDVIEHQTKKPLDEFVINQFYRPLGLSKLTYNPYQTANLSHVAPTENDTLFRKQVVKGYVHDPGAAMLGGIAGHAGLFSNANDLAVIMQMLLNKGLYGGTRYFKSETVDLFTSKFSDNSRRGLGFDKPSGTGANGNTAESASSFTFGHTGFTGTCAWADPKEQIVFIFLSNRVYPDPANNLLSKENIRTQIQQKIYDSIKK